MEYSTIALFIDHLKSKSDVVGIVEYGGRTYCDMSPGGDYDLTVITRSPVAVGIGGLHFNIAGIPVDCVIVSIDDFKAATPKSPFMLAHLNCTILFDRDNITKALLESIKTRWRSDPELTEREIGWFRFTVTHVIDKLKHRLHDDVLYSNYFMAASLECFLSCYARIENLAVGQPKLHFRHMEEHDPEMYRHFSSFYETTDTGEHFRLLQLIAQHVTKEIGGLWREDEPIFQLEADTASTEEKDKIMELLFCYKL